jgi:NADPH2:quinone reductase
VKIEINQRYLLSEAAQAHNDLEARNTTGSTVLIPE